MYEGVLVAQPGSLIPFPNIVYGGGCCSHDSHLKKGRGGDLEYSSNSDLPWLLLKEDHTKRDRA